MRKLWLHILIGIFCTHCKKSGPVHEIPAGPEMHISTVIRGEDSRYFMLTGDTTGNVSANVQVDCFVIGTATVNPVRHSIIFQNCDDIVAEIDPFTGSVMHSVQLPCALRGLKYSPEENMLYGHIYENGITYFIKVDFSTGAMQYKVPMPDGPSFHSFLACTGGLDAEAKNYYLLTSTKLLAVFDTRTGIVADSLQIDFKGNGIKYDFEQKKLYGVNYENGTNYLNVVDLATGNTLNKYALGKIDHLACRQEFDALTNTFILADDENNVLFFDVNTGALIRKMPVSKEIVSIIIWNKPSS